VPKVVAIISVKVMTNVGGGPFLACFNRSKAASSNPVNRASEHADLAGVDDRRGGGGRNVVRVGEGAASHPISHTFNKMHGKIAAAWLVGTGSAKSKIGAAEPVATMLSRVEARF
jgi:hypothetical protein